MNILDASIKKQKRNLPQGWSERLGQVGGGVKGKEVGGGKPAGGTLKGPCRLEDTGHT